MYKAEGKVVSLGPIESYKNGSFKKRTFVIETGGKFSNQVAISASQAKLQDLDTVEGGQMVEVTCFPTSNEYQGKWYTEVKLWKLDTNGQQASDTDFVDEPF